MEGVDRRDVHRSFRLGAYQQAEIIQRTQVLGTGSQPRNQVPEGRPRVNLVQIAFSRSAGVDSIHRKQVSAQRRSRTSPVGTAECSPGRQSWVAITTRNSPGGTAQNVPGRQSWVNLPAREC